ncbi:ribonuclease H [Senna tora]|uniref:Ribonuclease H n=1 Tax=Senna tora TaxID=362788 RepID=A0A834WX21_9FABA|nr:ribonuclease H [Senna tora]
MLRKGVRRVIGDGRATGIWDDPWVPSEMPTTLTRPKFLTFTAEYVCDLLVEDGSRWDEDRLGVLFDEDIRQRILSIPIDVDLGRDRWSWDLDRSGQYTVKMGYRNAMMETWGQFSLGLDIDEEATTRFWKRLWKLPIISRYKVFLWRACRGILPTVESLEERGMDIDELCIMCNNAHEDVFHALIDCPELQLMWVNANFDYSSRLYHANILEWLVVEAGGWKDEQMAFLAVAVYHAWERRNKKKFANEIIKVEELWPRVERMMEEIQVAAFTDARNVMELPKVKWEKPEYPFMKLNVDAAGSKSGGGAMGGLLRNSTGCCDGVFTSCVRFPSDPILLEAMSIKKGLELAKLKNCTHVLVECDSRLVVDMLHTPCDQASSLNAICKDILRFTTTMIPEESLSRKVCDMSKASGDWTTIEAIKPPSPEDTFTGAVKVNGFAVLLRNWAKVSSSFAEIRGILNALHNHMAWSINMRRIIIESDSLQATKTITE